MARILPDVGKLARWVVMPVVVVALGLLTLLGGFTNSAQENCGQDCTERGDVVAVGVAFLIALFLWGIVLAYHYKD
jgi:hypothetical protein